MSHIIKGHNVSFVSNCHPPPQAQPGTVWYDSGRQNLVVYDGQSWVELVQNSPILTWEAENAIDTLIEMLNNQPRISAMADKYPLVEDALGQLEVALKLCQNLDNVD